MAKKKKPAKKVAPKKKMAKKAPGKKLIPAPPNNSCACNECPFMKLNTLEKVWRAMEFEFPEVDVPADLRERALKPLERMLEWSK